MATDDETQEFRPRSGPLVEGRRLGPFQIIRLLGRGGMGEVYLAERVDGQVEQKVAIKVMGRRFELPAGQRRFRIEQQILARLNHPNIAQLFDVGTTPDDLAYLVMEWVDGEPVDVYANHHRLGLQERLALFQKICSAVSYAHRNLIIHRDLKPSNILVNCEGEPKLLDFGIAKLLGREVIPGVDETQTLTRGSPMTPAFASPEQIAGEVLTTSSDVYSLGILLYQLVTHRVPFDGKSWEKLDRLPMKPSEALLTQQAEDDAGADLKAERNASIPVSDVRGDLDNILLKAVRTEVEHRYAHVTALDDDVTAFLAGDPVSASRDTPFYLARRLLYRYRYAASVSAFGLLLMMVAFLGMVWQNRIITQERNRTAAEAGRTAITRDFTVDLLRVVDASQRHAGAVTLEDLLERGLVRLEAGEVEDPVARADLLKVIGDGYLSLNALTPASRSYGLALASLGVEPSVEPALSRNRGNGIGAREQALLLLKAEADLHRGAPAEAAASIDLLMASFDDDALAAGADLTTRLRLTEFHSLTGDNRTFLESQNELLRLPLAELEKAKVEVISGLRHRLHVMIGRGRVDEAEVVLQACFTLSRAWWDDEPDFWILNSYRGLVAYARSEPAAAIEPLERSIHQFALRVHAHDPAIVLSHIWLARTRMTLGEPFEVVLDDLDKGVEAIRKLLKYGEDSRTTFLQAYASVHYALAYREYTQSDERVRFYAQQALDRHVNVQGDLGEPGFMRFLPIISLGLLGRVEEAKPMFEAYLDEGIRERDVIDLAIDLGIHQGLLPFQEPLAYQLPERFMEELEILDKAQQETQKMKILFEEQ